MNLNTLQYFVDVVELSSFTDAGEKNRIAQTSISQQIKQLEKYFDCILIDRTAKPITPTKEGIVLFNEAKKVLVQFETLEKEVRRSASEKLKIEYSSIMDIQLLNELLDKIADKQGLNVEIEKVDLSGIANSLKSGKYDFAITFDSEFFDEPEIETMILYQGKYLAGIGTKHPYYGLKALTIEQVYIVHHL